MGALEHRLNAPGDRSGRLAAIASVATVVYVPVLALALWQVLSLFQPGIREVISSPAAVAANLASGLADGSVAANVGASLERALLGWIVTLVIATPLAIAAGRIRLFARLVIPVVDLLRPISPIAWIPLAVLWLGIGLNSKLLIVFVVTFFVVFLNVYDAVIRIPPVLLSVCRTFTPSRPFMFLHVTLPASFQGVVLGAQYGLTTAWGGVIVAEMVGANSGVGYEMLSAANQFDPTSVIAYMVLIGLVGIVLNAAFLLVFRTMLPSFVGPGTSDA